MNQPATVDIDPFDASFIEDPYAFHESLREAGPVLWLESIKTYGVARHAEVATILNDPLTFVSSRGVGHANLDSEQAWRPRSLLLETDPPFHDRVRAVMNRVVAPKALKAVRERWEAEAEALVDDLVKQRRFDAATELGEAYPLRVFPDTIGMRREGRHHLLPYAAAIFNVMGPPNQLALDSARDSRDAVAWVEQSCKRDMLTPGSWGADVYEAADRGDCTHEEAERLVRSFLSAGVDTTINGLSHLMLGFARFPGQWDKLRERPELIRKALDESLRWNATVQVYFRTTAREVELAGTLIPAGAKILLFLGAANRDPRRWENPDDFDIERPTSGHFGFGHGVHQCLGQMVARMEGELVLSALVRRVSAIRLAGTPVRRPNNTMLCMAHLPIEVEPVKDMAVTEPA